MTNKLNLKFKKTCKKNNYDPNKDKNEKKKENKGTALTTAGYPRFKGRCFTYGNFGHKSADCPSKKNNSGASSHMTNTLQGMYNQCRISSKVKSGSGKYVEANIIGDISGITIQKDGAKTDIMLRNIKYAPSLFCKLISLTTTMNKGFKMT